MMGIYPIEVQLYDKHSKTPNSYKFDLILSLDAENEEELEELEEELEELEKLGEGEGEFNIFQGIDPLEVEAEIEATKEKIEEEDDKEKLKEPKMSLKQITP